MNINILLSVVAVMVAGILLGIRLHQKPKCKTCKYWKFRVSDEGDICWGNCVCRKHSIAIRYSIPIGYRQILRFANDTYINDIKMKKHPELYIDTYYAECSYGCIYHSAK